MNGALQQRKAICVELETAAGTVHRWHWADQSVSIPCKKKAWLFWERPCIQVLLPKEPIQMSGNSICRQLEPWQRQYLPRCVCSHQVVDYAGKGGGRGGKTSIAGVKRGADALFQKQWENATEPSEAALSDGSAFPATTEASARCTPHLLLSIHVVFSENCTSPHPAPPHRAPLHPPHPNSYPYPIPTHPTLPQNPPTPPHPTPPHPIATHPKATHLTPTPPQSHPHPTLLQQTHTFWPPFPCSSSGWCLRAAFPLIMVLYIHVGLRVYSLV